MKPARFFGLTVLLTHSLLFPPAALTANAPPDPASDASLRQGLVDPEFLEQYAATFRFRLGRPSSIEITANGDAVLFLRSGPRSFVRDLYLFDPATGEERLLLTADQILKGGEEVLSPEEKARRERQRLIASGLADYSLSADGKRILAPLAGRLYVVELDTGSGEPGKARVKELTVDAGTPIDPQFSPSGEEIGYVAGGDLYVVEVASGRSRRLTHRQGETITHGLAEFVAQEEIDRNHGFWWSPDGSRIVYQRTDVAGVERFRIADPLDPSQAPQEWPYPRAGKANAEVRLGVLPAAGGETVWVKWDHERYPYLATVRWTAGAALTLVVQNRRQTEELVLAVDADSGESAILLTETDEAWLNLDQEMPYWLPAGDAFLWTTERGGSRQLELRSRDGSLIRAVSRPNFGYRGFFHYDAASDTVVIAASVDPTEAHLWRLPLDPARGQPERLSREAGFHEAAWSRNGKLSVHSILPVEGASRDLVRGADGRELGVLKSVTETPPFAPGLEFVTVGDALKFHAVVIRPRGFDPTLRYPVLVRVYGGPGARTVVKRQARYLLHQWMADQGFIVVSIDGRGTRDRGRAWARAIKYNFIDLPLADQSAALQALGRRFSELDLSRVGIFGWSFGGYFAAMATMRRPDLFHVGIAGAPVCDWRDYDTHYTERFIGLPQEHPEAYRASSVLTYAAELQVPLMIIHGTADDNVYLTHSLKISDALLRAGRPHDFLPLAGLTHSVADPLVTTRLYARIMSYLEEHLGDPRPATESLR